jgi:hypothetical protein
VNRIDSDLERWRLGLSLFSGRKSDDMNGGELFDDKFKDGTDASVDERRRIFDSSSDGKRGKAPSLFQI